jgi:hypothetical protein
MLFVQKNHKNAVRSYCCFSWGFLFVYLFKTAAYRIKLHIGWQRSDLCAGWVFPVVYMTCSKWLNITAIILDDNFKLHSLVNVMKHRRKT